MKKIARRTFLKRAAVTVSAGALTGLAGPLSALATPAETQPLPTDHEAANMAEIVTQTMRKYQAPAQSLAIARHGRMVCQNGFGQADQSTGEPATSASRFRIASVSKPITAVAIFSLIEQGRLGLHDLVFGEQGRLKFDYGDRYPGSVSQITIHHLLTHTCGGWQNDGSDPMFRDPKLNHRELITWALREEPLTFEPGAHYAYSNALRRTEPGRHDVASGSSGPSLARLSAEEIPVPAATWPHDIGKTMQKVEPWPTLL